MQRGGYTQPSGPANPTPPSQRQPTAADVAKAIDTMAATLAGYAVQLSSMRNARYADPLDRERAKVAHLRARVLGLLRALREAQAETGNALRIGAQYREAAERIQGSLDRLHGFRFSERDHGALVFRARTAEERAKRLEAIAREALDEWDDALPYVGEYLAAKWRYPERIAELRAELAGPPRPPAEPVAEEAPDRADQIVRVLEANGVDPSRATAREIQAAIDAVGLIGEVEGAAPKGNRP